MMHHRLSRSAAPALTAFVLLASCSEHASTPTAHAREPGETTAAVEDASAPLSTSSSSDARTSAPFALSDSEPATPDTGKRVYERLGCNGCHTTDSTAPVGPSFKAFVGSTITLVDGTSVTMDEARFREGIKHDPARAIRGFRPVGPNFSGSITEHELDALLQYVKTLQ